MNSRFSTAVHVLTLLASMPAERLPSEFIAASIGTNPVVVRRQLALLREAGLVTSKGARGGGWELTRDPKRITLRQVREALGADGAFRMHRNEPNPNCIVGQHVRGVLGDVYAEAELAVMKSLGHWTVANLLERVRKASAVA
ncbi:MAG: Rrf2 family transcriptional regulator [Terracidiphilus sp.]|nr:Rrf2 family transcriptional regulator [Terracidiphilus sp.]